MKLHFDKNTDGEIFAQVDGKDFSTKDYIRMIKEIKNKERIEADFGEQITQDEKERVNEMLMEINLVGQSDIDPDDDGGENSEGDLADLPF